MMRRQNLHSNFPLAFAAALAVLALPGCSRFSGRPGPDPEIERPSQVLDFDTLYKQNCSGCHGAGGKGGAAVSLADPVYLALVDDTTLRRVTANGVPRTAMPAFAHSAGGTLTDQQIDVLVREIRARWAKPDALGGARPPSYTASAPGDAARGAEVYEMFCASCHGPGGKGRGKLGSIVDGSYLALVSDQGLRTTVLVGVPDLGAPDWRRNLPGRPMTDQEVSDVLAWLVSQRPQFPGQPYASGPRPATGGSQ
jgi:mono/diheme cytochrome c family protein